ncbi:MAG TPA: hypothetical protein VGK32_03425 [Vicinamibacterales bacterium]|jgi:hypothetical protein
MIVDIKAKGFFAYIMGPNRGDLPEHDEVVACALAVPGWPHDYWVRIPESVLKDVEQLQALDPRHITDVGNYWDVSLDGWDVRIRFPGSLAGKVRERRRPHDKEGIPENPTECDSWTGFEMLPDYEDVAVGARLSSQWESRRLHVGVFRFSNGEVGSWPDQFTTHRTWEWLDRNNVRLVQPITDTTHYRSDTVTSAELEFGRDGRTWPVSFRNEVEMVELQLWSQPHPESKKEGDVGYALDTYALELAHMHATLQLCDVDSTVGCVIEPQMHTIPAEQQPRDCGWATSRSLPAVYGYRPPGKVNCGTRRLYSI